VALTVPPLRERPEDIPLMAQHFLRAFAEKNAKSISGFTPQAIQKLVQYTWPGNVRELMNAVERAVVLSRTDTVDADELVFPMADQCPSNDAPPESAHPAAGGSQNLSLEEVGKRSILEALAAAGGNKSEAARRLGITRKTLRKKLSKYETDGR